MSDNDGYAAPLHFGRGPTIFEVFVEPTCPFSTKAMGKLEPLLAAVGEDRVTVKLRLQSQPWHQWSGVVTRCVIAASTLPDGRDRAWDVLKAVAQHREEFVFENHATGPNRTTTPDEIIERIEGYSGFALAAAFDNPKLDTITKWHSKYARQNGIHVSPTFMVNGLIDPDLGSGDEVDQWAEAIRGAPVR